MRHVRLSAALGLAVALPAAAHTFGFAPDSQQACLAIGNATWRFAGNAAGNVTVRIDSSAAMPGLRIKLAETPDKADFVLVDDGAPSNCRAAANVKDVSITTAGPSDLVIGLASGSAPADYRIYVRSRWIAPETAAALFAAARMPPRRMAGRASDRSN